MISIGSEATGGKGLVYVRDKISNIRGTSLDLQDQMKREQWRQHWRGEWRSAWAVVCGARPRGSSQILSVGSKSCLRPKGMYSTAKQETVARRSNARLARLGR